jgi:hypothetical protein
MKMPLLFMQNRCSPKCTFLTKIREDSIPVVVRGLQYVVEERHGLRYVVEERDERHKFCCRAGLSCVLLVVLRTSIIRSTRKNPRTDIDCAIMHTGEFHDEENKKRIR